MAACVARVGAGRAAASGARARQGASAAVRRARGAAPARCAGEDAGATSEATDVAEETTDATDGAASTATVTEEPAEAAAGPAIQTDVARWNSVEPKTFAVGSSDQLPALVGGGIGAFLLRGGIGALAEGYNAEVVDNDPSRYSIARLPGGKMLKETARTTSGAADAFARPSEMLVVYEFQSCPYCRKVREAINALDLDATFYPVTDRSGAEDSFRVKAKELADRYGLEGRQRFPLLHDPGADKAMYESDDIIAYLVDKYGGGGEVPLMLRLGPVTTLTAGLAALARGGAGGSYTASAGAARPDAPIDFYGYEPSPFSMVVREKLCELGLAHNWYTTPRGSATRDIIFEKTGRFQVPYIEDPNTGVKMFESIQIVEYLEATYS